MNTFLEIFENYGWPGIIGILISILLFLLLKKWNNRLSSQLTSGLERVGEKLTDQLSQQNEDLVHCIIDQQKELIGYLVNKENDELENHNKMLNDRMILSEDINMKCKDIMNIHNSQRSFIIEFHNSYQNLSGIPFAKYSCNYEWFDRGLLPLGNRCIGLPFSSIAGVVQDVIKSENQQVIYDDMDKLYEKNPSLVSYFKDEGTKVIVYTGLHDIHNQLIGLLVLEYQKEVDTSKINLHQLDVQAAEVTSMLNIRYKYSK